MNARDASSTPRLIVGIAVRDAGNVLRTGQQASARDATMLRTVFSAFSSATISVDNTEVSGDGYSKGSITVSTNNATVTTSGGASPFTYAWTKLTGDSSWSIASPSAASTFFRRSGVSQNSEYNATFSCTVTDAGGHSATSPVVTATVVNNYGS